MADAEPNTRPAGGRLKAKREAQLSRVRPVPVREPVVDRTPPIVTSLRVRATQMGFFDNERKREGDVFLLQEPRQFVASWMEPVDDSVPERTTTGQQLLRKEHDDILNMKTPPKDLTIGG